MEYKDYYRTLGVDPKASKEEIKQAYQRLARRYHPDLSREPDAEARFKAVNEAYQVLKEAKARQAYDRLGPRSWQGRPFRPPPDWQVESNRQAFNDFFSSIFSGARPIRGFGSGAPRTRGSDLRLRIRLSLEEAYHGVTRTLSFRSLPTLGGPPVSRVRRVKVRVPAGVCAGQRVRVAQQGNPGTGGGPRGDLLLEVVMVPHPHFRTQGRDVLLELPITPWEAALGARLKIPTLGGEGVITLPPGVQNGHKLRLKGRGLPGQPAGDQLVILRIEVPPASSVEAVRLYRKMAEVMSFDPRGDLGL
jgi:curved DNA-binding protein